MASLGLHNVSLDSSMLSSCSSLRPLSTKIAAIKVSPSRTVQCSCSRQEESLESSSSSSSARMSGLGRLIATGLMAAAISTKSSSGIAMAQQDQMVAVFNVGEKADKLLKDADKLTNEESPPRFGPSRGGVKGEDSGRIAQKGGVGAVPGIQDSGSELVGKARDKISDKASSTKDNLDKSIGKAQDKADDAKKGIQGFFGRAQNKAKGDIDTVEDGSKDLKGLVGDARNKAEKDADKAGDSAKDLLGNIKKGLNIR